MTATALKNQNRERASHLARKLNMETDEFLNMVTAYVLDAVERTVSEHHGLTLPLEIEIKCDPQTVQLSEVPEFSHFDLIGLHPNSKAYANKMAQMLRDTLGDEEEAAYWYRIIRCREIPPVREKSSNI